MIATTHTAFWKTWEAKLSGILVVAVAMAPQLAPPDLAAWFHEQFPGLPSWASWVISALIFMARLKASTSTAAAPAAQEGAE